MTKINQIYKCEICGNVVSVLEAGQGTLVCCGQDMTLLEEKTVEQEGKEKHVPVVDIDENKVTVKVGSIEHPMEESHHILLIQIVRDGNILVGKRLSPGDKPEAEFHLEDTEGIKARALCNIHGLWTN
ncbi:MAG: desulfoferrodoxin [Candidatus Aenigmarchaeota archaeon]|nr:desulfoferrodoxin [Candidatus Aenigmarchaeota archaeon]MCK5176922.1 desulfoferrodoxin [Candidatus Aenigmarchaeota archaeon]